MLKLRRHIVEAQKFAQDHYNMDRVDFYRIVTSNHWEYPSLSMKVAISHWEEIQSDLEAYYDDCDSPIYADSPFEEAQSWQEMRHFDQWEELGPEQYNFDLEEGRR